MALGPHLKTCVNNARGAIPAARKHQQIVDLCGCSRIFADVHGISLIFVDFFPNWGQQFLPEVGTQFRAEVGAQFIAEVGAQFIAEVGTQFIAEVGTQISSRTGDISFFPNRGHKVLPDQFGKKSTEFHEHPRKS
jgi:hypothetical protein